MANTKINEVLWDDNPVSVTEEVNFIWNIANKLRGVYQSDKYKDVIIPMTIIRRFECALEPTKTTILKRYEANPNIPAKALYRDAKHNFYNISRFNLKELLNDSTNIATNFKAYINGFSSNVQDIIHSLNFEMQIDKMDENNLLYNVIQAFSELNLDPLTIDNVKMGYIFEDLIRRFSENAEAGDHYTGRDIIKTMVNILLAEGCDDIFDDRKVITILDQACGTGGMLSTSYNFIHHYNPTADIRLYGQEINPESYAICLAEMMIKGQDAENIKRADTRLEDCFSDTKMRFVIMNPPFGTPWGGKDVDKTIEKAVLKEYEKENSRWGAGLPSTSDMQLLFLQSAINKLDNTNGRCAIVENGSPLFSGGVSSGESQIRRWLLENDLLEAIIALPTDMFYNTGIATYIWILSKYKREERKGKVQLIDATSFYEKLRKALGNKRNEITPEHRATITKLYADFKENEYCKIFDNEDFMYREYAVMQPLQRNYSITEKRIQKMIDKGSLSSFYDEVKINKLEEAEVISAKDTKLLEKYAKTKRVYYMILDKLRANTSEKVYKSPKEFMPILENILTDVISTKKDLEKIAMGLSEMDKTAEIHRDKKGNIIYDPETKDTEIVPYKEKIDDYMAKEVLPHVPDAKAFFEEDLTKKKPVIKTGAEIPFTRYFYKYQAPKSSEILANQFIELEKSINQRINNLFGGKFNG